MRVQVRLSMRLRGGCRSATYERRVQSCDKAGRPDLAAGALTGIGRRCATQSLSDSRFVELNEHEPRSLKLDDVASKQPRIEGEPRPMAGAPLVSRRDQGARGWGYAVARKAWNDGCRTPHLADSLASMTVLDGVGLNRRGADPKAHLRDAVALIEPCLAAHAGETGSMLRRLERRRERLQLQLTAERRPSVQQPRNPRRPRPLMPGSSPASRV
jgi:hypothetical protein